ncbi:hypothetical protein, partial [Meiothermus hypogaeus]|uniref:hypothetical protein n=1 Tax=Meiothermus hypogaeus TaxID=884155 RepID=UPI00197D8A63
AATFDFHTSAVLASYTIFGLLWVIHKSSLEAPSFAQPNFLYDSNYRTTQDIYWPDLQGLAEHRTTKYRELLWVV